MIHSIVKTGKPRRLWLRNVLICLCLVVGLAGMPAGCQDGMSQLGEVQRLAVDMRVQLNLAATASIRAVMAKTDADSTSFAREAEQARQTMKKDVEAMLPLLRVLTYTNEVQMLEEFNRHFTEYETMDRRILALAVENTNLKALQLSFGPAQEAAVALRAALDTLASLASPKNRCRVDSLVASAALAVREIQVLQAPHIAESSDPAMARMEKEMAARLTVAHDALGTLAGLIEPSARGQLAVATASLERFADIHKQIIALSRRNSNSLSLDLTLGKARSLTAACDGSIGVLQAALAKEGVRPTR